MTTWSSQK